MACGPSPLNYRPETTIPRECQVLLERGALVAASSRGAKDSQAMTILLSRIAPRGPLLVLLAPLGEVEWSGATGAGLAWRNRII